MLSLKDFKIFLLAVFFSLALNEANRIYLIDKYPDNTNGKSLVKNWTIWSKDNNFYLPQVKHFFNGHGYTIDPANEYMRVRRTPGYSVFFGIHAYLFGPDKAYYWIRFSQVLLFALSAVALAKVTFYITSEDRIANLAGFLYALNPFAAGYCYYTITEGIHPAFMIFSLYFFYRAQVQRSNLLYLIAGIFVGLTVLIRPLNGLILPFMGLVLLFNMIRLKVNPKEVIISGLVVLIGFLLLLTPWVVRNYKVTKGEIVLMEKYYNEDPMVMGKGHLYFRKWWSCWENSPLETLTHEIEYAALDDSRLDSWIKKFIGGLPEKAFAGYDQHELESALRSHLMCSRYKQQEYGGIRGLLPGESIPPCEEQTKREFVLLIEQYKQGNPMQYYVYSPLSFAGEFVFQSFSSMLGFLNPTGRNFNWWQMLIKAGMYLLNLILYFGALWYVISSASITRKIILFGLPCCTLLLFAFYFRFVESRYMLQTYPMMFISLSTMISAVWDKRYLVKRGLFFKKRTKEASEIQ